MPVEWYFMVWKRYAQFSGRARRKEYWFFTLFNMLISLGMMVPFGILLFALAYYKGLVALAFLLVIPFQLYCLASFLPSLAVTVRRLHDTGRSGWWYFIAFVPFVGPVVLLIFTATDSEPGPNIYGPNPKDILGQGYGLAPPPFLPDGQ